MTIRFDDKVAIVTGAGGGIGKQHALNLDIPKSYVEY